MLNRRITSSAVVVLSFVLAAIGVFGAFKMTPSVTVSNAASAQLRAATAMVVAMASLGGSVLFLGSLQHFQAKLRLAYRLFAFGILLFGLALIQLPIIGFKDAWNSMYANSGLVIVPFIFATLLIYAGMQHFALLLGVKSRLTEWRSVLSVAAGATVISFVGGHYVARYHDIAGTDIYIAIVAWSAVTITFATLLARGIVDRIGPFYQSAMRWLVSALVVLTFAAWHEYVINYFMNNDFGYVAYGWSFWPFILSGIMLLKAGYAFVLLGTKVPYIPVHEAPGEPAELQYADNLASLAALISYKDSSVAKDIQSTVAQTVPSKANLVQSYNKLENYLTQKDPVRRFGRQELRGQLHPGFRALVEQRNDSSQQN